MKKITILSLCSLLFVLGACNKIQEITYSVTWKSEDGTTTIKTDTGLKKGSVPSYTGADPTKEPTAEYTFTWDGWSDEIGGEKLDELPAISDNATYYAHFTSAIRQYTVTFNSKGGTAVASQTVNYNGTLTEPEDPTKDYNTFVVWTTDEAGTNEVDFDTYKVTADATLYAKWTKDNYGLDNVEYDGPEFEFKASKVSYKQIIVMLGDLEFTVGDDAKLAFTGYEAYIDTFGADWTDINKALTSAVLTDMPGSDTTKVVKMSVDTTVFSVYIVKNDGEYNALFTVTDGDSFSGTFTFDIVAA